MTKTIIVLHGNGGSGKQIRHISRMDESAAARGWGTAFPNAANGSQWDIAPGSIDSERLGMLISKLDGDIFVVGTSNGAQMACSLASGTNQVKAIGCNGATLPPPRGSRRVPLVAFHGTADPLVPYSRAEASIKEWRRHNGNYAPVHFYPVTGGGHTWPGGRTNWYRSWRFGATKDWPMNEVMLNFFSIVSQS